MSKFEPWHQFAAMAEVLGFEKTAIARHFSLRCLFFAREQMQSSFELSGLKAALLEVRIATKVLRILEKINK